MQFQPALDAYIAERQGDLAAADAELAEATQWEDRCAFPFENFLPVLHLARSRGLPLVAMGVDRCVCMCVVGVGGQAHENGSAVAGRLETRARRECRPATWMRAQRGWDSVS